MIRVVLTILLPLLAPTAIYLVWLFAVGRAESAGALKGLPWTWLVVAGVAAVAVALLVVGIDAGGGTGQYVPPHVEGGSVVPGRVVPPGPK
jgi:uncharacterized membrane protein